MFHRFLIHVLMKDQDQASGDRMWTGVEPNVSARGRIQQTDAFLLPQHEKHQVFMQLTAHPGWLGSLHLSLFYLLLHARIKAAFMSQLSAHLLLLSTSFPLKS